jgi:hypothetical protein
VLASLSYSLGLVSCRANGASLIRLGDSGPAKKEDAMSTTGSPYGELPPTHDAEIGLDVKDPHEHHWFTEPTEKVSNR